MKLKLHDFHRSLLEIRRMTNESQALYRDSGRFLPLFKQLTATGRREMAISYRCQ